MQKAYFTYQLVRLGGDLGSRYTLLREFLFLDYQRRVGGMGRPFSCRITSHGRSALISFTGTLGEILTLVEIFQNDNYVPHHNHTVDLFGGRITSLLDLGANIGLTSVWFALTYPEITIDAYEPNPELFPLLKKNLSSFPKVRVFEEAITGTEGHVSFNKSKYSLESSIFEARDSESVSVTATTLDQAIKRIGGSVDLLKIDIEGAEFDAFTTSTLLPQVRAITGEAHTEQSGHTEEELSQLLSSFDMVELYNPNNDTVFGFYAAHTRL